MENSASIHLEYQNPYDNYYWIMQETIEEAAEGEPSENDSEREDRPAEDEGEAPERN